MSLQFSENAGGQYDGKTPRNGLACFNIIGWLHPLLWDWGYQRANTQWQSSRWWPLIANSTVTLWAASEGAPQQLGQARTSADGGFERSIQRAYSGASLYLIGVCRAVPVPVAPGGDNPAIALMTVVGGNPPATVTINEMTTVASAWTHTQFLDGAAIKGPSLSLRIAAGNVPNFVDLQSGGWGATIQDPLNSGQTPTMANFATLASVLAGCVTRITADACPKLYTATIPPRGDAPNDTLAAAQALARFPAYQPARLFALLDQFYPIPQGKTLRKTPFLPYLSFAPTACGLAAQVYWRRSECARQTDV